MDTQQAPSPVPSDDSSAPCWLDDLAAQQDALEAADRAMGGCADAEEHPPQGKLPERLPSELPEAGGIASQDADLTSDKVLLQRALAVPYAAALGSDDGPSFTQSLHRLLDHAVRPALLSGDAHRTQQVEAALLAQQQTDARLLADVVKAELLACVHIDNGFSSKPTAANQLLGHLLRLMQEERSIMTTRHMLSRPCPVSLSFVAEGPQQVNIGSEDQQRGRADRDP